MRQWSLENVMQRVETLTHKQQTELLAQLLTIAVHSPDYMEHRLRLAVLDPSMARMAMRPGEGQTYNTIFGGLHGVA